MYKAHQSFCGRSLHCFLIHTSALPWDHNWGKYGNLLQILNIYLSFCRLTPHRVYCYATLWNYNQKTKTETWQIAIQEYIYTTEANDTVHGCCTCISFIVFVLELWWPMQVSRPVTVYSVLPAWQSHSTCLQLSTTSRYWSYYSPLLVFSTISLWSLLPHTVLISDSLYSNPDLKLLYLLGLSLNTDPTCCQPLWSYDHLALYNLIIVIIIVVVVWVSTVGLLCDMQLPRGLYHKVLAALDDRVMPYMTNPLQLSDFLINSYNLGLYWNYCTVKS